MAAGWGKAPRPLRGFGLSVAVRQEGFALGVFRCSITPWDLISTEQEIRRELMNLPWQYNPSVSVMLIFKVG